MKSTLLLSIALVSSTAFARFNSQIAPEENEYKCNFQGVQSVELPVDSFRTDSNKFKFKYQVVGNLDPEKIVVINIPGGPGGSSINDFANYEVLRKAINNGMPSNAPWIMIDPRTVGCNRGDATKFPDETLTSDQLALDILGLIKSLGLKKYVLHGHSYGSQSATFVAGLAKAAGVNPPHAIFLSGVLGRGEESGNFSIPHNLILEWELLKANLSPKALTILSNEKPLGFEPGEWDSFITNGLYVGYEMIDGKLRNILLEDLMLLDSDDPEVLKKLTSKIRYERVPRPGTSDFSSRLFAKVDCHEFSPADGYTYFDKGKLYFDAANDPCKNEAFDRPYDSASFEIRSPIYYLVGTNDPAAPYEGAKYHFDKQPIARKNMVTVKGGGHLRLGWVFQKCKDQIWNAIFEKKDWTDIVPKCGEKLELTVE